MASSFYESRLRDLDKFREKALEKSLERESHLDRARRKAHQKISRKKEGPEYVLVGKHVNGPEWLAHKGPYDALVESMKFLMEDSDKVRYEIELYSSYKERMRK